MNRFASFFCIYFLSCLLFPGALWSQKIIPFVYFQDTDVDADQFEGTVEVSLVQTRSDLTNYNFSQVSNPIILEVKDGKPGEIRVKFEHVIWGRKHHRDNQLVVTVANLTAPRGLGKPLTGVSVTGKRNSSGELVFPIVSNGSGRWTLYFDVISEKGRETQRAGKVKVGAYKIKFAKAAWEAASRANTCEAVKHFLAEYPSSPYTSQAQTLRAKLCGGGGGRTDPIATAWNQCIKNPTKACLEPFLKTKYEREAGERLVMLDDRAWRRAEKRNLCRDYQNYLIIWTKGEFQGSYVPEAQIRVAEGNCRKATSSSGGTTTTKNDTTEEDRSWYACLGASGDSAGGPCMDYLNAYPEGKYREEAIEKLPNISTPSFTRNPIQTNVFTGYLNYALAPIKLVKVHILGGESSQDGDIFQGEDGIWRYLGDILTVRFFDRNRVEVIAGEKHKYEVTISDTTNRQSTFIIDATRPPLKVIDFSETEDSVIFHLAGGQPPYIMQVLELGSEEVKWELTNIELNMEGIAKIDVDQERKLRGAFKVRFLDERRTEYKDAITHIHLEGRRSFLWLILLGLEMGLLVWLYFIFFRRNKSYA